MGVMGGSNLDLSSILQLLRICIVTEDKETIDVIVNEDDTVWSLKIRLFEHTGLFPGKQSISFKTADEVQYFIIQIAPSLLINLNFINLSHIIQSRGIILFFNPRIFLACTALHNLQLNLHIIDISSYMNPTHTHVQSSLIYILPGKRATSK